jgi:serine/threonine protein phosphatase 1
MKSKSSKLISTHCGVEGAMRKFNRSWGWSRTTDESFLMIFARRKSEKSHSPPRVPRGYRVYSVGDVHGRLDLLDDLLVQIEQDMAGFDRSRVVLVFLGDLIDRGPSSRQVIERLQAYRPKDVRVVFLAGNHEEVLLRLLAGERGILADWLKFGGLECMASYGVDSDTLRTCSEREALEKIKAAIPSEHQQFIAGFHDTLRFGDYLFVHAGIRPDIDLSMQSQSDLRWIRQPFLDDERDHGFVVVHGHTINQKIVSRSNRIGIDTGAYRTGVLTAAILESDKRRFLSTASNDAGALRDIDLVENAFYGTFSGDRA